MDPTASRRWRYGRIYLAALITCVPIALVLIQAVTWTRHGIDVPAFDDWRQYVLGYEGSFDPSALFLATNGTVTVVGRALDAAAYVLFGGNVVVYELLSMLALLGAILFLQWRLLRQSLGDVLLVAGVFLLTLASLRAGTLWGHATMAFQQGMPVVLILASLWLVLRPGWAGWKVISSVLALGAIAGLTYISGAFASTAVAVVLLGAAHFAAGDDRSRLVRGGGALLFAGLWTMAIQVVLVFGAGPVSDAVARTGLTMPWDTRFWAYLLGIVGGSLWQGAYPSTDREILANFAATVTAIVLTGVAVVWAFRVVIRRAKPSDGAGTCAIVLLALTAGTVVYLGLVAGARTQLEVPAGASLLRYFENGRLVHHPFWVTLLWPWVGATLVLVVQRSTLFRERLPLVIAGTLVGTIALTAVMFWRGAFDYERWYSISADYRRAILQCLVRGLDQGRPLYCQPGPEFGHEDLTEPILRAMAFGASFTRYLQMTPADDSYPMLFDLDAAGAESLQVAGDTRIELTTDGVRLEAPASARARVKTARESELADCRMLEVRVKMRADRSDLSALLWSRQDSPDRELTAKPSSEMGDDGFQWLYYFVPSDRGFADTLTLWAVATPVELADIEVRCRIADVGG